MAMASSGLTGAVPCSTSMAMAMTAGPKFLSKNSLHRRSRCAGSVSCRNAVFRVPISLSSSSSSSFSDASIRLTSRSNRLPCLKRPHAIIHDLTEANVEAEDDHDGLAEAFLKLSPAVLIKLTTLAALVLSSGRALYKVFFNPALWTYASWLLVIWPLPASVVLGLWAVGAALPTEFNKRKSKKAKQRDQFLIIAGALTWLILVPLGFRNGYVEGWPLTLSVVYMYFLIIPAIIKLRRYGEFNLKSEAKQWSSSLSTLAQVGFVAAVVAGHWAAAFEGPIMYFSWNWQWPSRIAAALIAFAITLQYSATYFLDKYFNRNEKPAALVIFGPYRFVRHPMYTSYMILFAGFCIALRAYWSMAFLVIAAFIYYEKRAMIEELMLEQEFGKQEYDTYRDRVKFKFFPFLY